MKRVLRGNWAKRKPVFIGKSLQSEGSVVQGIRTPSICVKRNLAGTEKFSVPFGSVRARLN
jgi:hypothetical protein